MNQLPMWADLLAVARTRSTSGTSWVAPAFRSHWLAIATTMNTCSHVLPGMVDAYEKVRVSRISHLISVVRGPVAFRGTQRG